MYLGDPATGLNFTRNPIEYWTLLARRDNISLVPTLGVGTGLPPAPRGGPIRWGRGLSYLRSSVRSVQATTRSVEEGIPTRSVGTREMGNQRRKVLSRPARSLEYCLRFGDGIRPHC